MHQNLKRPCVCMVGYTEYMFDARVRLQAETLAKRGIRVICIMTRDRTRPRRYVLNGVEIHEVGLPKYQGKSALAYCWSYLRFLLLSSAICVRLLVKRELDVVHAHNLPDILVLAGLIPRLAGCKVVLDVHDSMPETFATKFPNASIIRSALCLEERLSAGVAHKVICVNHPQRDTLVARGIPPRKTFVSMNVPDPAIFTPAPTVDRSTVMSTFNLVYHGTMADRLGVDLLIRAVSALRDRIPGVRLHLWGRGDDLSRFSNLARELRTDDTILFNPKGFPLDDLPHRLNAMDLGIVGNRRSVASDLMLPVKLMEYVSLGIPVVVPRLRTIAHYFSDDMVTYYEPENVDSLSNSIYRLYKHPEIRSAQASCAGRFLREYGWQRQGSEFVDFYQELVEN